CWWSHFRGALHPFLLRYAILLEFMWRPATSWNKLPTLVLLPVLALPRLRSGDEDFVMFKVSLPVWVFLAGALAAEAAPKDAEARAFLNRHCLECHGAEKPKGQFRVDSLALDFRDRVSRDRWLGVLKRIQAGEMPPKGRPRPPAKDSAALTSWIRARADAAEL